MTLKTIKNTPPPPLLHPQLSIITQADLKPPSCSASEGRVSIVRWDPKGMRRSTGP